jgi:hypothetical protein
MVVVAAALEVPGSQATEQEQAAVAFLHLLTVLR